MEFWEIKWEKMTRKKILSGLVLLFIITSAGLVWLSSRELSFVPSVTFRLIDGRQINLNDLHGRPVLVTFWATTCAGCMKEMPHLISLYNELSGNGLEIIGVAMSYDPPNQVLKLIKQRHVPYPISIDIDGSISKAFGNVKFTPTTFLIAPDGKITLKSTGELDITKLRGKIKYFLSHKQIATRHSLLVTHSM
jgi:peroxiredoxin